MTHTSHTPYMDPPKFLFLPARPLVCGLAVFGATRSLVQFFVAHEFGVQLSHLCVLFLDVLLFFGALKNNVFALKWSQRVTLACVIIAVIRFMIYPVVFASLMASGLNLNETGLPPSQVEIIANVTSPEDHFVLGLVSGFTLEFATAISIGVECLKYVMVHRLWEYAKYTDSMIAPQRYVVP